MNATPRPLPLLLPLSFALLAVVAASAGSFGSIADSFEYAMPPGQRLYLLSKLAGIAAVVLLITQVALVAMRPLARLRPRYVWDTRLHGVLGLVAAAVLLAHVGLFVAAASLRGGAPALDLLLPVFGHGSYRTGLSLGGIGLLLLMVLVPLGPVLRRSDRSVALRLLHRGTLVALLLGISHALIVGSDHAAVLVFAAALGVVLVGLVWRWIR